MKDIVVVFAMTIPMLLFSVYPGLRVGDFLEQKYNITEKQKIIATIVTTISFTLLLSVFVHSF